jgi:vanillate monooxygenase ferredoxin subunit
MSTPPTLSVRVARKQLEARDICSFELVATDGGPLPAFSAGSHVDVHLPGSITRQYSLCNSPDETHRYVLGVLRDATSRGGSQALHDSVQEGQVLQISVPRNHFALVPAAGRSLLLAGGIGITPLLCMAEHLSATGADFALHYCTRSAERTAFRQRLGSSRFASQVKFHFSDGAPEQRLDMTALLAAPQEGVHLYVCGPRGFMDAVLQAARSAGWPETHLHYEFFAGEVIHAADDASFSVKLASSGKVVVVPKDKTVVQALAEAGVEIMISCEQGVCGTCLTRVLEGIPDHRDSYLQPEERQANDQFMPCCSRSKTRQLVLDL